MPRLGNHGVPILGWSRVHVAAIGETSIITGLHLVHIS